MGIQSILRKNRIIAATELENLPAAIDSKASAILLMHLKLIHLLEELSNIDLKEKALFLHADLIKGLSNDREALQFLVKYVKPTGIVTTKSHLIRLAKNNGLITIQRIFLIDTSSLQSAIKNIKENEPDAIEIMPGIASSAIPLLREHVDQPIIMAGLIRSMEQIREAIEAGADAVSLGKADLWNVQI